MVRTDNRAHHLITELEHTLLDVILEAHTVDNDNSQHQGTIEAIEGPFYLPNAPALKQPYLLNE